MWNVVILLDGGWHRVNVRPLSARAAGALFAVLTLAGEEPSLSNPAWR